MMIRTVKMSKKIKTLVIVGVLLSSIGVVGTMVSANQRPDISLSSRPSKEHGEPNRPSRQPNDSKQERPSQRPNGNQENGFQQDGSYTASKRK